MRAKKERSRRVKRGGESQVQIEKRHMKLWRDEVRKKKKEQKSKPEISQRARDKRTDEGQLDFERSSIWELNVCCGRRGLCRGKG